MTCEHSNQTLLWLYGESEDDTALAHIASCEACTALVAEHEQVQALVAPVAPQLMSSRPEPANQPMWRVTGIVVAAVALLAVGVSFLGQQELQSDDTDLVAYAEPVALDAPLFGDLDAGIEALDLDLADLSNDFGSL